MPRPWFHLHHPPLHPADNMAWDEALLERGQSMVLTELDPGQPPPAHEHDQTIPLTDPVAGNQWLRRPVLRFYGWAAPAATFGYFQKIAEMERLTPLRPLIRRPTGGGLVPHDADWTYSVVVPPGDPWYSLRAIQSYRRMHEWIRAAFATMSVATDLSPCARPEATGQCFLGAEQFDVLLAGRKLAGASQRRTKNGLLIQGSIQPPAGSDRLQFEAAMLDAARRLEGAAWEELEPDSALQERVRNLVESKYARVEFNRRR